jgi:hypothetical protein
MAYYKIRFEVWRDWDPEESDPAEIGRHVAVGEDAMNDRTRCESGASRERRDSKAPERIGRVRPSSAWMCALRCADGAGLLSGNRLFRPKPIV